VLEVDHLALGVAVVERAAVGDAADDLSARVDTGRVIVPEVPREPVRAEVRSRMGLFEGLKVGDGAGRDRVAVRAATIVLDAPADDLGTVAGVRRVKKLPSGRGRGVVQVDSVRRAGVRGPEQEGLPDSSRRIEHEAVAEL